MSLLRHYRFRPSLVVLHWLTLALLAAVYATMELRGLFPRGSVPREAMKTAHYFLGLAVFAVTLLRLVLRATGHTPPINPPPPAWQAVLARIVALVMYALMLAMPVIGYLILGADGKAPAIGGWSLPVLVPGSMPADALGSWHEGIALAGYWLVGLHAAAALYHHHIRGDNTLLRMSLRR